MEKQEKYANLEKTKKITHVALIARRKIILKNIVGSGQELNVGLVISLVMWRKFVEIKETIKNKPS